MYIILHFNTIVICMFFCMFFINATIMFMYKFKKKVNSSSHLADAFIHSNLQSARWHNTHLSGETIGMRVSGMVFIVSVARLFGGFGRSSCCPVDSDTSEFLAVIILCSERS